MLCSLRRQSCMLYQFSYKQHLNNIELVLGLLESLWEQVWLLRQPAHVSRYNPALVGWGEPY